MLTLLFWSIDSSFNSLAPINSLSNIRSLNSTKLLKPVMAYLRSKGDLECDLYQQYPPNGTLRGNSQEPYGHNTRLARISRVSGELTEFTPDPDDDHRLLGFQVDSNTISLSLPHTKVTQIKDKIQKVRGSELISPNS